MGKMAMTKITEHETLIVSAKRTAVVCAVIAAVLSVLLLANYLQTRVNDPIHSPALTQLMQQLQNDPDNQALKEQIRALDLLARKAYFTHKWQLRTGGFILFAAVVLLLISIKYLRSRQPALPDLQAAQQNDAWQLRLLSRRWIVWGGVALFAAAFATGILAENQLAPQAPRAPAEPVIPREVFRANWPSFRGPETDGRAFVNEAPAKWNGATGEGILWQVTVPKPGFNSPIIWGERLYLSGADQTSQEVYCYNTADGALLWTTALNDVPGRPEKPPKTTDDTGLAAPTMTTDGRRLFVLFATGDLACLDFDGKRLWAKNLGVPDNHYGHSSSLVVYQNLLLVQYDHAGSKTLRAFRTADGKNVYQTKRDDVQLSWASPLLIYGETRDQIVLSATPFVISYDPASGKELWRVKCMDGEVAPSPAYAGGRVMVVNEYARLAAIQIDGSAEKIWEYEDDLSEVSSPLATDRLVIMASSYGTVTCLNAETGEVFWTHDFDKGFYSSPILVGDLVYLMDVMGVTHIFKAAETFESVAGNPLGESAHTIPAFMPGRIYLRGDEHLFCIGN